MDHSSVFLVILIYMNIVIIIWLKIGEYPNVFEKLINYFLVNFSSQSIVFFVHCFIRLVTSTMFMPRLFDQTPPSYLKWARLFISKSDNGNQLSPFPYIASVTHRIVLCTKVIFNIEIPSQEKTNASSSSSWRLISIQQCPMHI